MWRYIPFFTLILLYACTTTTPSKPDSVAGRPPGMVIIEVASQIERRPYSSEELADPVIQSIIAQCERQRGPNCRSKMQISKRLKQFVRTQDKNIYVQVGLRGIEADRDYKVELLFFDPTDNVTVRGKITLKLPPNASPQQGANYNLTYRPPSPTTLLLGQYRIQVSVNGQVEGVRTFEVVD